MRKLGVIFISLVIFFSLTNCKKEKKIARQLEGIWIIEEQVISEINFFGSIIRRDTLACNGNLIFEKDGTGNYPLSDTSSVPPLFSNDFNWRVEAQNLIIDKLNKNTQPLPHLVSWQIINYSKKEMNLSTSLKDPQCENSCNTFEISINLNKK